jgi:23S rRNA (uracil1939-C5)-methyltransferase
VRGRSSGRSWPTRGRRPSGGRAASRATSHAGGEAATVGIAALGAAGDGLARLPDGRACYVPGALPGETVEVRLSGKRGDGVSATLVSVVSPSPDRAVPPCPHIAVCGGCTVQHLADAAYAAWKRGLAAAALARAGFAEPPLAPLSRSPAGSRRRADLALRRSGGRVIVGFHGRASGRVAEVPHCRVLHPALLATAAALREALPRLACLRREGSAILTLTDTGIDLWLMTDGVPDADGRAALAAFAASARLARLSWSRPGEAAEPVATRAVPAVRFSGVAVPLPQGAFLQATAEGEAEIVSAVLRALRDLPDGATVADLYAGCGTLTFPLARRFRVRAAEGDAAALAALQAGIRAAGLSGRVVAAARDLAAHPLAAAEQAGLAAAVLDPPRDGARAQVAALAAGPVRRIVYVSCNVQALARDAKVLAEAGFRLDRAVPVDQFLWSAHLECVASFSR